MTRILHVYERDSDFQTRRAIAQLHACLGTDFGASELSIGRGGDHLNIPSAAFALRRRAASADIVHAWGAAALTAAAFAPARHVVFSPTSFPTRRQVGWVRAVMNYRDVHVVCASATLRRTFVERGVPIDRCHLIRPGVDFARVKGRKDAELRAALGFSDDQRVLLAVGESTRAADHRQAVWAGAILNILDHRTRVLLRGRGPLARAAATFAASLKQPELVTLAESRLGRPVEFDELLPAADMAIVSATGPVATLPIATAMAGGLPIVATVTPTVAELLEDRHTALMTQPAVPRLLAQRVMHLRDDAALQWKLADTARTEAFEFFAQSRFLEQYRALYSQIAVGKPVDVPQPPPGAGLRFHGRA
jgi:glycosyltransferase involved in cell wall biosynthesis